MPIPVTCTNIVRYDKETGKYVYCKNTVNVSESRIGETIECPKCGGSLEVVPQEPTEIKTPRDGGDLNNLDLNNSQPSTADVNNVDLNNVAPLPIDIDLPPDQPSAQTPPPPPATPKPSQVQAASPASPNWLLSAPPQAAQNTIQAQVPCINCHTPINRDEVICPSCGYKQPEDDLPDEEVGFQGWMRGQMAEGTSPLSVILLLGFLCSLCLFSCVAWSFVQYGGLTYMLVLPFIAVAVALGVVIAVNRRAEEPWLTAIRRVGHPWTLILLALRAWKWRDARPPFTPRRVLDYRGKEFTDDDLLAVEELAEYEVLDLEGTQLTDKGVLYLREVAGVRFLVLLRTQATSDAVRKLQQTKPAIWIWHD